MNKFKGAPAHQQNDGKVRRLPHHLEIISKEEAKKLNKMFFESEILSEAQNGSHFREDTGAPKKAFEVNNFRAALYELKLKFPQHTCSAYTCKECGKVHLGKS